MVKNPQTKRRKFYKSATLFCATNYCIAKQRPSVTNSRVRLESLLFSKKYIPGY